MELAHQGIKLDSVVRALWEIVSVEYSGQSKTPDLKQYRAAEEFPVLLRFGSGQHEVIVDVFWGTLEILEHKLGLAHQVRYLPATFFGKWWRLLSVPSQRSNCVMAVLVVGTRCFLPGWNLQPRTCHFYWVRAQPSTSFVKQFPMLAIHPS